MTALFRYKAWLNWDENQRSGILKFLLPADPMSTKTKKNNIKNNQWTTAPRQKHYQQSQVELK